MTKKKAVLLVIVLLLITNVSTFLITNFLKINMNDKTLIQTEEYRKLKAAYDNNDKMRKIEDIINSNYLRDVDKEALEDGKLKGMVDSLKDPYSQYFNKEEFRKFNEDTVGSFAGIGIVVTPMDDNYITVVSPIAGTPAERAGIKTEDKIIKVDGVEYTAKQMEDAVSVMRGEPGTDVTVTILRKIDGKQEILDFDLTREIIKIQSIETAMIPNTDLGYIKVISFDQDTYKDYKTGIQELKDKGAKGIVFDLRGNPGGLLDVVINMADDLLGDSTILFTKTKAGQEEYFKSNSNMDDIPAVVLIDKGSASASEIFAGALKDNGRAKLVGETSFGKGVVQRIHDFPDGTGMKITESEYFLPNGESIHEKGVSPDYEIKLPDDIEGIGIDYIGEDTQLQKAIEILSEEIN
ncbi:MAG: S41 family peptidase [Tissierellia bacterium]|nr:S41 family peptidase [Tissierellia bacterium]